jgi:hypothetical protein
MPRELHGFESKRIAERLAAMARSTKPVDEGTIAYKGTDFSTLRTYLVELQADLDASPEDHCPASKVKAWLMYRDHEDDCVKPDRDDDGERVEDWVYNPHNWKVPRLDEAGNVEYYLAVQDMRGTLWVLHWPIIDEVLATLAEDMCPGSGTVAVDPIESMSNCDRDVSHIDEAENLFNRAGCNGDYVLLGYRDCTKSYFIKQVYAHAKMMPVDMSEYNCTISLSLLNMSVEHCCEDPVVVPKVVFEEVEFVTALNADSGQATGTGACDLKRRLSYESERACVLRPSGGGGGTTTEVLTATKVDVLVDHSEGTNDQGQSCVYVTPQEMWVWCEGDLLDDEELICAQPCPTGTGTGTAQGS